MSKMESNSKLGLNEAEVLQRRYEYGKNLVNIKHKRIKKKYEKCFKKKVRVIRNNELIKVKSEFLVPGDVISIKAGDLLPADGYIIENSELNMEEELSIAENNAQLFKGTKVVSGNAMIEVTSIGEDSYFGKTVKQVDAYTEKNVGIKKNIFELFLIVTGIAIAFFFFGFLFSFFVNEIEATTSLKLSIFSGLILLCSVIPAGLLFLSIVKSNEKCQNIENMKIKNMLSIMEADKINAICIRDEFLVDGNEKYVQDLYNSGIRIIVITEKKRENIEASFLGVKKEDDSYFCTGKELNVANERELIRMSCETICFCEMSHKQKEELIKLYKRLKIRVLVLGENLEDTLSIAYSDVGLATHSKTGHFEYEIADGVIYKNEISSIYNFIRNGFIVGDNIRDLILFTLKFQLPVAILLLIALLVKIDLNNFTFQTLMSVFIIIPLLMILGSKKDFSETIFEIKEERKRFNRKCVQSSAISVLNIVLILLESIVLVKLRFNELINVNIVLVTLVLIYSVEIILEKKESLFEGIRKNKVKEKNEAENIRNKSL